MIEYQFLSCFDEESSRRMRTSLLLAWEKNDMPLRDARPWIHDMDCSVGGLSSCNIFYSKQISSMYKNYYYSNKKHESTPAKKRSEINQQKGDKGKTHNVKQEQEEHESQEENEQRLNRDRRLRFNAARLRLNFQKQN